MTRQAKTWTYDVFLNFRGEDTRYGFIGNLKEALKKKGVRIFFDDEEIRYGDEITPTLLKAIQESRMAITVFSKEYASSTFCLNELVQIHQCIMGNGRRVWPIFYDVEPSEVRKQRGKYGRALDSHEQNSRVDEDKMESWKQALREVANVKGSPYDPRKDYEHKLIEEIVNHILSIIKRDPLDVDEYRVGLNSRVEKINSLLELGSNDKVIMIGIWGTGGMGKTTIARAVYNTIVDGFDYWCFLDDIKGDTGKQGLKNVQVRMLSKILGEKLETEDINQGVVLIKQILKCKKILLILDNVDEPKQLEKLAGACEWFGRGSRIIITTRDLHLLEVHGVERIYEMEELNYEESLELLSWKAFGKKQVDDPRYKDVVERVISYADGLPLALEVIGSDLKGKNVREWESMLDGCKRIPHDQIQQILKISYDGLQQHAKEVFLDIACFYNGYELEYVKEMVRHAHDFGPADYHIGVLEDKCLIKGCKYNYIKMHDLVQDMGRNIVRQESPKDPGKCSRIWSNKDILRVLEENEGTNQVIIIIQVESSECIEIDYWDGEAFKNMKSLKILILENAKFSQGPKYLPNSLAVLRWRGYPSSSLPCAFRPKDLVEFDVRDSNLSSMETISKINHAKVSVLNFSGCKYIEKIPNLSGLSSLKKLLLYGCEKLIEIDNSVGQLAKLETLDVNGCIELRTFPRELNTPSLVQLCLDHCWNLNYFPEIVTREMKISELSLVGTGIDQLPPSVENLTKLTELDVEAHKGIRSMKLPSSINLLPELISISVKGFGDLLMEGGSNICPHLSFHSLTSCKISNENLRIYLQKVIRSMKLPSSIVFLHELHMISVEGFEDLRIEAGSTNSWSLSLTSCKLSNENLRTYLTSFSNVVILDLMCSDFTILPACIEDCQNLVILNLEECKHLIEVEKVPPSILILGAGDCTSLSSESRKLLLSKELLASLVPINHVIDLDRILATHVVANFCVPGGSIPEWFDHCSKEPSISFWFRDQYLPTNLIVGAILEPKGSHSGHVYAAVFINEEAYDNLPMSYGTTGYDEDHIIVNCFMNHTTYLKHKSYAQGQWKHAKICLSSKYTGAAVKESGIYVIRDERTTMENIRFTDPFQCSDLLTNDQGFTTEGDTATNNPFSPSQSERPHTDSHAVLDIDFLSRLSAACSRLTFPISIHMDPEIVDSKLEYFSITKQDVMEFLNMQEPSIPIIQVFVMFVKYLCCIRRRSYIFGFLCPNVVQGVGCTREDRISYIGRTIKEGNKQCWLAPIREGNHWTLCAICPESNIIYWFDSLGGKQSDDIEKVFTEALETYQIIGGKNTKWLCPNYRRQLGNEVCGYYVMRYMYEIIGFYRADSLDIDRHLNDPECYSRGDIDFIRNQWSSYFLRFVREVSDALHAATPFHDPESSALWVYGERHQNVGTSS